MEIINVEGYFMVSTHWKMGAAFRIETTPESLKLRHKSHPVKATALLPLSIPMISSAPGVLNLQLDYFLSKMLRQKNVRPSQAT